MRLYWALMGLGAVLGFGGYGAYRLGHEWGFWVSMAGYFFVIQALAFPLRRVIHKWIAYFWDADEPPGGKGGEAPFS